MIALTATVVVCAATVMAAPAMVAASPIIGPIATCTIIGASVGAGYGFVSSMFSEAYSDDKTVNWKNVWVDTATGGIIGGLVGAGAITSTVGLLASGAGMGAINYAVKQNWNDSWEEKTMKEHLASGGISAISWAISTWAGGNMVKGLREMMAYGLKNSCRPNQLPTDALNYIFGGQGRNLAVQAWECSEDLSKIVVQAFKGTFLPTLYGYGISATEKLTEWICNLLYDLECIE